MGGFGGGFGGSGGSGGGGGTSTSLTTVTLADIVFDTQTGVSDYPANTSVAIENATVISPGVTFDAARKSFTLAQSDIPYHCEAHFIFDVDFAANADQLRMQWIFYSLDGASTTPVGDHNTAAQVSDGVGGSTDGAADVVGTRSYTLVDASAGPVEIQLRGVNVGTDLDLVALSGRIFQAPTTTVVAVDPALIDVNDQTSSGYMDIGTMRIQWGINATASSQRTQVLPAPFANTSYTVQLTGDAQTGEHPGPDNRYAGVEQKTTVAFDIETTGTALNFSWLAIGLKP